VTSTPDDDRLVEIDDLDDGGGLSTGAADDAAARDDELHAEAPLELDDDHLRGDDPPGDVVP
jgi:hypothetical protein